MLIVWLLWLSLSLLRPLFDPFIILGLMHEADSCEGFVLFVRSLGRLWPSARRIQRLLLSHH